MSGNSTFQPKNKILKWIEDRLPIMGLIHSSFGVFPTPRNLNYWWTFGGILAFCLIVQVITGIILVFHYTPEATMAFDSVEHIMRDVNYGWLMRYVHFNGASMFFAAVYIHIMRGLYYGSYKNPRELLWIIGVVIYIIMMATAFMGYVLPWGQMSYWAATVITNLFTAIPVVGESITQWLLGGYSVNNPTLNRFFGLHYLLPFVLLAIVVVHVWALHVTGNNNPTGVEVDKKKMKRDTVSFHPYYTVKDFYAIIVFFIIFCWFVFFNPNFLGHPDNYIPADPLVTPPHIVPEWYFLPFYAILRAIPDKLGGVVAMAASLMVLFFVSWLDTSKVNSARYRPIYKIAFWILIADFVFLGYLGAKPAEPPYVNLARLATFYYFAHFLVIMPLLGFIEKPKSPPESIDADVESRNSKKTSENDTGKK